MKTSQKYSVGLAAALLLLGASVANAANITINDNNTGNTGNPEVASGWYKGGAAYMATVGATEALSEYEEVEPGMQISQGWDLAAFVNPVPGKLGVVSGYDLANGFSNTTIGDIFVSLNPGALNPPLDPQVPYTQFTTNTFGYDYAVKFNFSNMTYDVIQLTAATLLENGEYAATTNYNSASNPWRVAAGYDPQAVVYHGNLTYTSTMSETTASTLTGYTVNGYYKYYAEISTGWLADALGNATNPQVLYKLTMECGNDNMLGLQTSGFNQVPDGSATLALLGLSFLGLVGASKLKNRKIA